MALDFATLYFVVLLNSLLMAIVWVVVYRSYEQLSAAGIWALACITAVVSGVTLASASFMDDMLPIFLGNLLVVFAFSLFWAGIRRFEGRHVPWAWIAALVLVTALILIPLTFVDPDYSMRNVVYAVAQSIPLVASILDLHRTSGRRVGRRIAMGAMGLAIAAHGMETIGNGMTLLGITSRAFYAALEPSAVLVVVFSGVLWNFGLVLMVVDRLYARLEHKALHDELTGLPNRRALAERITDEIAAANATRRPLALLVVDLDALKELNDRHGHGAGDAGLVHVARTVRARLRPGDMIARTGGDEFCVVLPGTSAEQAGAIAAALVGAVQTAPLAHDGKAISLTLSIGGAEWQRGQNGDALTAAADAALYAAKTAGRNRYAVAGLPDAKEIAFRTAPADLRA